MATWKSEKQDRRTYGLVWMLLAVACLVMTMGLTACGEEFSLTIQDGVNETEVSATVGEKVEKVLDEAGITLGEKDEVTPALDTKLTLDDTVITIARYAEVTVIDEDGTYDVELVGGTVQDALDEAGITLDENDVVDQDLDAYLTDGMQILVARAHTEEVVETEVIEYETEYQDSSSIYTGQTSVSQEGENGEKEITYEVTYDPDGNEISREMVSEKVTKEPVTEIILQGTKTKQAASSSKSSSGGSSGGGDVVSREAVYDCDGSGHGYYIVTHSDGSVTYQDF